MNFFSKAALVVLVFGLATPLVAEERKYSTPFGISGCGLGSLIISKRDKQSQIISSVVNSSPIGFVTSSITSGTSNCNYVNAVTRVEQKVYISSNLKSLEKEAAQGTGLHLASLAQLFGCEKEVDVRAFLEFNKKNFSDIYGDKNPENVFKSFKEISKNHDAVINHCPGLS